MPTAPTRRRAPPLAAAGAVIGLLVGACGASAAHRHSLIGDPSPVGATAGTTPATLPASTTASPPVTAAATTMPTSPAPRPARPYAVGTTTLDLTDPSRSTGSQPGRHLPTLVLYPAAGGAGAAEVAGAPALPYAWPLVVFAHGYNVTALTYHDLLHHLAQVGFVVVAPRFPLEAADGPLDENDLQNEPGDIRFVITEALAAGASGASGPLAGAVDSARIAAVGHSDGGEAVLGAAFLPGESDSRIGPVVSIAAQAILNGDHLTPPPVSHPLLVVQGTRDTINPPARSDHLYAGAPLPKAYLHLIGGDHLPPVADATPWRPIVETTVVDWLDAWFGGPNATGAAGRLGHDGDIHGVAVIQLN